MVTPGGVININESYLLSGEEAKHRRRDLRSGVARGRLEAAEAAEGPALRTVNAWGTPFPGSAVETFTLPAENVLRVDTVLMLDGSPPLRYRTIYRRPGR